MTKPTWVSVGSVHMSSAVWLICTNDRKAERRQSDGPVVRAGREHHPDEWWPFVRLVVALVTT
jgi:hypothetical protein